MIRGERVVGDSFLSSPYCYKPAQLLSLLVIILRLLLVNLLAHPGLGEDKKHIKEETWDGAVNVRLRN